MNKLCFTSAATYASRRHVTRTTHSLAVTSVSRRRHFKMAYKRSAVEDIQWLDQPVVVAGKVQRGFGRGSRDLGTPTANLPGVLLDGITATDRDGVYLGYGRVPKYGSKVVKMVANLGRNITFDDVKERVLEAYLMSDEFDEDFYGEDMRLCIIGFMRPEWKFSSLDELIEHINNDVAVAKAALDLPVAKAALDLPVATHLQEHTSL